jgi:RNA polymerase sigma factor (sigma-70 family)
MAMDDAKAAFVDLLERHRAILVKVANAYCRDTTSREDLIQEIATQLWRAHSRFDGRGSFSTWMYRIAVNVAISFYRTERRKASKVELADRATLEEVATPQETGNGEALTLLREFVDRLDDLNRALMILYLDDNSYAEIAAILGISETNVATKIGRIKGRLKDEIGAVPST